jgi:hypothetical protein
LCALSEPGRRHCADLSEDRGVNTDTFAAIWKSEHPFESKRPQLSTTADGGNGGRFVVIVDYGQGMPWKDSSSREPVAQSWSSARK